MTKETDIFYSNQSKSTAATYTDPEYKSTAETWLQDDNDTINSFRVEKIITCFDPLIKNYQNTEWLTVGDGRFGSDAHFLEKKGVNATATDIQDDLLKVGFEKKFIKKFAKQNAESLTYDDNSFDFAFCKDAYHHFPRPALAVYEMLRVARIGIVLHEPKDVSIYEYPLHAIFGKLKRTYRHYTGKAQTGDSYETAGNYIYTISNREIEKIALGLNYCCVAFHLMQDHYIPGIEFEKIGKNPSLEKKLKRIIKIKEWMFKLGLYNGGVLTAILFKRKPSETVIKDLKQFGYSVKILSKNPYIKNN